MQQTIRSYLTAGVAFVGAGAIALAPINPVNPALRDIRVPAVYTGSVNLSAISNPSYAEVFALAGENLQAVVADFFGQYESGSTPLNVILANQAANLEKIWVAVGETATAIGTALTETVPTALEAAFTELAAGNFYGAINHVLGAALAPVTPLLFLAVPIQEAIMSTISNVVKAVTFLTNPVALGLTAIALAGPFISAGFAAVASVQAIVDSFDGGNPLQEIINAPAAILNGFLNGGYGPDFGGLLGIPGLFAGGLLTPVLGAPSPGPVEGGLLFGPFGAFLEIREQLANQIRPEEESSLLSEASAVPATDAKLVSLSVADPSAVEAEAPVEAPAPVVEALPEEPASATPAGEEDGALAGSEEAGDGTEDVGFEAEDTEDVGGEAEDGTEDVGGEAEDGTEDVGADTTSGDDGAGDAGDNDGDDSSDGDSSTAAGGGETN